MLHINQRQIFTILCALVLLLFSHKTRADTDSLMRVYTNGKNASDRMHASVMLAGELMPANMDSALTLIQLAEPLTNDRKSQRRADYFNTYGVYLWYSGQHDKAIGMFARTMELKRDQTTLAAQAMAANNMGALYSQAGQVDSARKYLEVALQIDTERDNLKGLTKTMYDLGVFYHRQSQYDLALEYILKAADYQTEQGDEFRLAQSLNVIGNIYYEIDSLPKAARYYHQSAALARNIANRRIELLAYSNLSAVFCIQPALVDSTDFYVSKGMLLAKELRDTVNMLLLNHNMGMAYLGIGNANSAMNHLKLAHELVPSVNRPQIHTKLFISMGKAYTMLGNFDEARSLLNKAMDLSQQIKSLFNQADAHLYLSQLDSIEGNYHEALRHFQLGSLLRDSINNRQTMNRFAELMILHKSTQNALKFELLERKERDTRTAMISLIISSLLLALTIFLLVKYMRKRRLASERLLVIQKEENEKKQAMLETHQTELTSKAISLIKSEDLIRELRKDITGIIHHNKHDSSHELRGLLTKMKREEKSNELWSDFTNRFNELHNNFITKLIDTYHDLSPAEIRMCAMLRMQLSTKEIADITRRSSRTIEYTRTNIRKKMGLNSCDNLTKHLLKI